MDLSNLPVEIQEKIAKLQAEADALRKGKTRTESKGKGIIAGAVAGAQARTAKNDQEKQPKVKAWDNHSSKRYDCDPVLKAEDTAKRQQGKDKPVSAAYKDGSETVVRFNAPKILGYGKLAEAGKVEVIETAGAEKKEWESPFLTPEEVEAKKTVCEPGEVVRKPWRRNTVNLWNTHDKKCNSQGIELHTKANPLGFRVRHNKGKDS